MATKLQEILGDTFVRAIGIKGDSTENINFADWYKEFEPKGEFICLYFSAHWAPPCRLFTQILHHEFYDKVNSQGKVAEVIFVTDDRTDKAFLNNIGKGSLIKDTEETSPMPWCSQPF